MRHKTQVITMGINDDAKYVSLGIENRVPLNSTYLASMQSGYAKVNSWNISSSFINDITDWPLLTSKHLPLIWLCALLNCITFSPVSIFHVIIVEAWQALTTTLNRLLYRAAVTGASWDTCLCCNSSSWLFSNKASSLDPTNNTCHKEKKLFTWSFALCNG